MLGERVAVFTRRQAGTDGMGDPIWGWDSEVVEDVLVREVRSEDLGGALRPDGVRVRYRLTFPRSWTATKPSGHLEHARVALLDRGMDASDEGAALRVSGYPDVPSRCPTRWNLKCYVGRVDG